MAFHKKTIIIQRNLEKCCQFFISVWYDGRGEDHQIRVKLQGTSENRVGDLNYQLPVFQANFGFVVQGVLIPLILEDSEATALLSAYNASDASSPSEAVSRQIARAVLDALSASRS